MRRKTFARLLLAEAVACLAVWALQWNLGGGLLSLMSFPFAPLGQGLRWLSLSGVVGNVAAILLYVLLSLLPLGALLLLKRRQKLRAADGALVLLSVLLFAVLYFSVNPHLLSGWLGMAGLGDYGLMNLGCVFYSVLAAYLVLRVLRLFLAADTGKLQRYLTVLLVLLAALMVAAAFYLCPTELTENIRSLREGNQGNEHQLGASYIFLVLKCLVSALPYLLDVAVVFGGLKLLETLKDDCYSEAAVAAAAELSRLCVVSLSATMVANVAFNLLQLISMKSLRTVSTFVSVPVLSIAFVLAALLLARYIRENKQLKDENDLFV